MANEHFSKGLSASVNAPPFVAAWRARALIVGLVCSALAVIAAFLGHSDLGWEHFLRGWLEGFVMCFGFCFGGMALLEVQYLSGGKWGLIVRRPLEAMSRTWPLVILMFLPVAYFGATQGHLYPWAQYADWATAYKNGQISAEMAHYIHWKSPMLNAKNYWIFSFLCFAIL